MWCLVKRRDNFTFTFYKNVTTHDTDTFYTALSGKKEGIRNGTLQTITFLPV